MSARLLDRYPQLYSLGQSNRFFRARTFAAWIVNAVYHSIILYIGGSLFFIYDGVQQDSNPAGKWVWGTAMYGAVLLTVLGKAALVTNNWTKYHVIAIPGSFAIWLVFVAVYGIVAPKIGISVELFGVVPRMFSSPSFWLQMPTLAILCLARDFTWKFSKRLWRPEAYHHVQEIQKYNIQDYRPRYVPSSPSPSPDANRGFCFLVWSNSKRPSARSGRCSACASSAGMPSRRPTSRRPGCCRRTIRHSIAGGMARWRARGRNSRFACLAGVVGDWVFFWLCHCLMICLAGLTKWMDGVLLSWEGTKKDCMWCLVM